MRISLPAGRRRARIEIIPLIDVVFFLLATFVMVSLSMVKNQGIAVHLPSAVTAASQDRSLYKTITVMETGDIYLDEKRMSLSAVMERLRILKSSDPEIRIFINGDERAPFGAAIRVLDEIRAAGITKVSIQTKGHPTSPSSMETS